VPILRDFERRLGGLVEGLFATTFRSGLQPIELAKRVQREMDAERTVGMSEVWAPNRFEFSLSPVDMGRFDQAKDALVAELEEVVRATAAERGWGLVGPPEIELGVDPRLKKGSFRCDATLVEGEEKVEPAGADAAQVIVHDGAEPRTVMLTKDATTIGRLGECDVVVADKGASRRHAQIRRRDGTFTLTDLGSTNGTRLNGQTIQSRELADGDRITIGATTLEFRRGAG
jgi:FhaA, N-terminal domain/FHA domain